MVAITSKSPWGTPESLALLHACRTQDDLERELATGFASLLPGVEVAFCLSQSSGKSFEVRFVIGGEVPLQPLQVCTRDAWQLPEEQRLGITFKQHLLGEVWLGVAPSIDVRAELAETLVHVATAMVNLALNSEARDATHEYCATLQALEEGIVLFQEHDEEAMMARLLSLASGMVEATAGALYVLAEVGKADSELVLMQALGMPDHLLESFVTEDGSPWPESLLAYSAKVIGRDEQGHFDGLADECAPGVLQDIVVLPLRYHGVQAGVCVLFNPKSGAAQAREYITRLQSFGQLAAALLHRLSLERLKENSISIGRELQIAATIQKRLVPTEAPPSERYEFAWSSLSAKNIGGDYVDVVPGDLDDLYTIVADASGHGINSALLMTSFRANYRGNVMWQDPPELAVKLNNAVAHEVGPTGMFITAAMVRLEQDTGRISLCSAGHNPVMLFRAASGTVEQIESHGPPLGFMANAEFEGYRSVLQPGDVLLLYTDGITEATDSELDMFGEERLERLLCQHAVQGTAQEVLQACLQELAAFTGRTEHEDDVSLMVVKAR